MEKLLRNVIINELLVSLQHAIITCRITDDIVEAFSAFYEDTEIAEARNIVLTIYEQRSTTRKFDKKKVVAELLDYLRKDDFKGKNIAFAAINIFKICNVHAGIGEELRQEIHDLKVKYSSLTNACGELKKFSDGVENIVEEVKLIATSVAKPTIPSYLNVAKEGNRTRHVTGASRPTTPASPPISQKVAMGTYPQFDQNISEKETNGFILVERKKRTKSSTSGVGGTATSNVKSVPKPRVGFLFMTRCAPETTIEEISAHVTENSSISKEWGNLLFQT
ncbi:unnamed protein product [Orchesella dallaii]|uniref:Uncharacterized protein n=1 Tax=Orchesella dallaii TaxID=48710 RepID=A0ABP1S9G5_9HEXA